MDDACRCGRDGAVGMDMRHDVVLEFLFLFGGVGKVDVFDIGFQRFDLLIGDRQTELAFGAGKLDPEPAPGLDTGLSGEKLAHIFRRVACREGRSVVVFHRNLTYIVVGAGLDPPDRKSLLIFKGQSASRWD